MKWVTWENVGIDRMGCAWVIRKYIDPKAEFLFVPKSRRPLPEGAEPFDIPGVRLSHHGGHCSFHTILKEYKLDDPALKRIARIIDEADTVQEVNLEPASPGLDLICRGIRMTSTDDHVALERSAIVYDALYAQIKSDETEIQSFQGFWHLGLKDDHAINAAEWIMYDALYAYCREMVRQGRPHGAFRQLQGRRQKKMMTELKEKRNGL